MSEQSYVPYQDEDGQPLNIFSQQFKEKNSGLLKEIDIEDVEYQHEPLINKKTIVIGLIIAIVVFWFFV